MQNRWPEFLFYFNTVNSCINFMNCNWSKSHLRYKIANLVEMHCKVPLIPNLHIIIIRIKHNIGCFLFLEHSYFNFTSVIEYSKRWVTNSKKEIFNYSYRTLCKMMDVRRIL